MIRQKDGFGGERALVMPQMIVNLMEDDPLTSALHITDIGFYPNARHHYRERKEPINQYVFIYCTDGAGWYRVGGREFRVHADQYFILPAGDPHVYAADEKDAWTIYWVHFKGTLASIYAAGACVPTDLKTEANSRISNRIALFEEIFGVLRLGYGIENLRYVSSLFHHYLGSLRYLNQYRSGNGANSDNRNVAEAAIHYMKENIEKRLTLEEISRYTGYSSSRFSTLFRGMTGHAPLSYFNLLRIQQACFLLDETDMRINQVCHKIGIDDNYYFSRLFSRIMGMSPSEYRMREKG